MPHPGDGALRRLLDEPAGVADADRRHVVGCDTCLTDLAAVRADAAGAAELLTAPARDADLDAAWRRLSASVADRAPARASTPRRGGRVRELLRRPAAGALAVSLVLAGAGTAAAHDWLPVFRTERVAPVSLSTGDLLALPDLGDYGDLELSAEPAVRSVPDAERAEDETGLDVPEVTELPAGISGEPVHQLVRPVTAVFTFSADRAARAAAATGETLPTPPPGLDGTAVRLEAGPGVAQVWTSPSGAPALLVARAQAPTASSSGAPFPVVRDYLLSLPGLPDDVARQLRTFAADGSTLPLPVPEQYATTSSTDVGGVPATVLQTRDGALSAVVWVEDGVVALVAGSLDEHEVVAVARGLR